MRNVIGFLIGILIGSGMYLIGFSQGYNMANQKYKKLIKQLDFLFRKEGK